LASLDLLKVSKWAGKELPTPFSERVPVQSISPSFRFSLVALDEEDLFSAHMADKFYEGSSQEKTHLLRLEFFLLRGPFDRARSVLTYRALCSVAGPCGPGFGVFSTSGFHRLG
jgi:hypothetical protein